MNEWIVFPTFFPFASFIICFLSGRISDWTGWSGLCFRPNFRPDFRTGFQTGYSRPDILDWISDRIFRPDFGPDFVPDILDQISDQISDRISDQFSAQILDRIVLLSFGYHPVVQPNMLLISYFIKLFAGELQCEFIRTFWRGYHKASFVVRHEINIKFLNHGQPLTQYPPWTMYLLL